MLDLIGNICIGIGIIGLLLYGSYYLFTGMRGELRSAYPSDNRMFAWWQLGFLLFSTTSLLLGAVVDMMIPFTFAGMFFSIVFCLVINLIPIKSCTCTCSLKDWDKQKIWCNDDCENCRYGELEGEEKKTENPRKVVGSFKMTKFKSKFTE